MSSILFKLLVFETLGTREHLAVQHTFERLHLDQLGGYGTPKGRSEKLQSVDPAWRGRSELSMSESFAKLCSKRPEY